MLADKATLKILSCSYIPSPALIVPLPVNRFSNKLAPKVPNNIPRNHLLCPFPSFLIVSSWDLTVFIVWLIFSFGIIIVVTREAKSNGRAKPNIFLWIAASVAYAAAVNPNGIKTVLAVLAGSWNAFLIKDNPVFSNGPKFLPKNLTDYPILCNWVFDDFIWADESFVKGFWRFEICVLVNNNLCGKLFLSLESPTTFDEIFRVTSVPFFIPDFNSSSCEFDNFEWFFIKAKNKIRILL